MTDKKLKPNLQDPHPGSETKLEMLSDGQPHVRDLEPKIEMKPAEDDPHQADTIFVSNDPKEKKEEKPTESLLGRVT